jgi:hypothetical protein
MPICVKLHTAEILVERNLAITLSWYVESKIVQVPYQQIPFVFIPNGSNNPASGKNFEPIITKVVIGTNNTVEWENNGIPFVTLVADNFEDPLFSKVTNTAK